MIEKLRIIYKQHYKSQKIDLMKIVRQKSSSFKKIPLEETPFDSIELGELEAQGLIAVIDDWLIILPLGFAYLLHDPTSLTMNNEYQLLKELYEEQCKQIVEPLQSDNYSELDCALGIFILLMGSVSNNYAFPFISKGKTYEYYNVIHNFMNYIAFRLFYCKEKHPKQLKNEIELRNILGRNDKSGNLIKRTKLHAVENDRGKGIKLHWFELSDLKEGIVNIFDGLFLDNKDLITMLNLKKIAMDNLLVNNIPVDLKNLLGDRPVRANVLTEIISYVNYIIEDINGKTDLVTLEINDFHLDLTEGYDEVKRFYKFLTDTIWAYPQYGIYFIELHFRVARIKYEYEQNLIENRNFSLLHFNELLGSDIQDLLNECRMTYNGL